MADNITKNKINFKRKEVVGAQAHISGPRVAATTIYYWILLDPQSLFQYTPPENCNFLSPASPSLFF